MEFTAVSRGLRKLGSFVGICPSPVESESSVMEKGLLKKKSGYPSVRQLFFGKSLRKEL